MALKHDSQGFLIGEIADDTRELLRGQQASMSLWKGIRADVSAIVRAIGVQTQAAARMRQPGQVNATPARSTGGGRTAGGNSTSGPVSPVGRASRVATAGPAGSVARRSASAAAGGARATATVAAGARDSKGRFAAGAKLDKQGAPDKGADASGGSMGGAVNRLTSAVGRMAASLQATDNLDPSINAAKEVTDVVAPLGRGLSTMFGRSSERKKERWYNRFWNALKGKKGDANTPAGGGSLLGIGGGGGFLGSVLGTLLGRKGGAVAAAAGGGLLSRLLGRGKGVAGAAGGIAGAAEGAAGAAAKTGILGRVGGFLKGGGKLLKRVPLLGALLTGGAALGSMLGMDDDPSKTPEQNRAQRYRGTGEAAGMGIGGVLGGLLGSLLGPAGTVAGALVGSIVGEKVGGAVGDWTKGLIDSDIGGKIVAAWETTTTFIGGMWDSLVKDAKTAWEGITASASEWWDVTKTAAGKLTDKVGELANIANDWIKEKTNIDVKQTASNAWDKTKEAAGNAWEGYKTAAGKTLDFAKDNLVPNTVKRAVAAGAAAATQAKAGYDERRGTETTTGAPQNALQSAARSAGSAAGGLGNMIAKHEGGYGSFNRGNAGDSGGKTIDFSQMTVAEIMAAQSLKKGDANRLFAVGKYQVIPSTMQGASKAMGLKGDEKFTPELQERIFAEYLTDKKRPQIAGYIKGEHDNLASAQLAGAQEWASIADPKTGKSFYAGSGNNRAGMSADKFGAGLNDARANYKALIAKGVDSSLAYSSALRGNSLPPVSSPSVPTGVASNVPSSVPPNIPPLPTESMPSASGSGAGAGRGTVGVTVKNDISQNVPDRGVAHVQTGGLGGM